MPDKTYRQAVSAVEEVLKERFCTNCRNWQKIEGGQWIKRDNGMRRRWKCSGCLQRARGRAAQIADTAG